MPTHFSSTSERLLAPHLFEGGFAPLSGVGGEWDFCYADEIGTDETFDKLRSKTEIKSFYKNMIQEREIKLLNEEVLAGLKGRDYFLDVVYDCMLEKPMESDAQLISFANLPADGQEREVRLQQLEMKLVEYAERLADDDFESMFPECFEVYKRDVLRLVLRDGVVNTWALSRAIYRMDGEAEYNGVAFEKACAVIDDYIATGGAHNSMGTGLTDSVS